MTLQQDAFEVGRGHERHESRSQSRDPGARSQGPGLAARSQEPGPAARGQDQESQEPEPGAGGWESGWGALYGRAPRLDDHIVPRSIDGERTYGDADDDIDDEIEHEDLWPADQVNLFHADLDALGIRRRRGHC